MRAVNTVLMVCAMAFGIVIAMRLLTVGDVVTPVPEKIPHAMRHEGFLFILSAVVSFVCPVICS